MKPVVLLIDRLPDVVSDVAGQLEHLPVEWLGAHDQAEVICQLETEPRIQCVIIGGGLDDHIRGDLVGIIAARRPDLCIHIKDHASGHEGMAPFAIRVTEQEVVRGQLAATTKG